MAFKDLSVVMYDGSIRLDYKDSTHRYYARPRLNNGLPETDDQAWGPSLNPFPKGATTVLDETLEKKGLMLWPLGLAMTELFGYYDFVNEDGERKQGFSKDKGTLMPYLLGEGAIVNDLLLDHVNSANTAHTKIKTSAADVGTSVHTAIEEYITTKTLVNIEATHISRARAKEVDADGNVSMSGDRITELKKEAEKAQAAFDQFKIWWDKNQPELVAAEGLVYSKQHNISGTFDALIKVHGRGLVLADFKTSNASKSKSAAAPQGVYYSYFIQSAIYALIYQEMTGTKVDDLLIVSCRKDGGFDHIYLSSLGLGVDELLDTAVQVITLWKTITTLKQQLLERGGLA